MAAEERQAPQIARARLRLIVEFLSLESYGIIERPLAF
jgi:hypothetical protein